MWNRVFLLASGFLFGWSLVGYWTVPRAQMSTQALRLGIAVAIGGAVIVLLGLESVQAAAAGVVVFAISAVIAYAGNARQVNRLEEPTPMARPGPGGIDAPRWGVVLASCLEPPTYDGPDYWAWRLRRREERGEDVPHWFTRPRAYARIRSAYRSLAEAEPAGAPPRDALCRVGEALGAALGGDHRVETARLVASPALARVLTDIARDGITRVLVQPLAMPRDTVDAIRAAVTHSRVREVGVRVTVAEPLPVPAWDGADARLDAWLAGRPPDLPASVDADTVARLQSHVVALEQ